MNAALEKRLIRIERTAAKVPCGSCAGWPAGGLFFGEGPPPCPSCGRRPVVVMDPYRVEEMA